MVPGVLSDIPHGSAEKVDNNENTIKTLNLTEIMFLVENTYPINLRSRQPVSID